MASRGLHYHASTQNWPMIAGGRSESYNDRVRIRNPDIGDADTKIKRNNGGAHQGPDHPRSVGAHVYCSPWVMPGVRA